MDAEEGTRGQSQWYLAWMAERGRSMGSGMVLGGELKLVWWRDVVAL